NTIDWSYSLLSGEERDLFARLSVFAGGCSFEAAEAVCNPDGQLDLLEVIEGLVDKSLVRQEGEEEPRFAMLETIREYAAEKLDGQGEGEQMRRAHAEYFAILAEDVGRGQPRPASAGSLDRLEAELSNVRAALQWARDGGDVKLGLRLAVGVTDLWEIRSHLTEGRRWLQDLLSGREGTDPAIRAYGLKAAARLAVSQHDWLSTRDWGRKSLAAFGHLGERREMAHALNQVGTAAIYLRDFAEAARVLEHGLALARESGDSTLLGRTLANLAWAGALAGDLKRASALGEEGLVLSRAVDNVSGMATALDLLLYVARLRGDMQRARRAFAEYVALVQRSDFHVDAPARDSIERLAISARGWGDYRASSAVLERAMSLSLGAGDVQTAAHLRVILALVERENGRYERAIKLLEESLTVFRASEDPYGVARALLGLADVARDRGDGGAAIAFAQESLALHRKLGDAFNVGWSLNNLAMGAFHQGDYHRADALLQEALALMLQGEAKAEILTNRGLVALAREEYAQAKEQFANVLHAGKAADMVWLTITNLDGTAMAAAGLSQAGRAARLFGAADVNHRTAGTPILPAIRPLYDRHVAEARSVLKEERFAAVWEEGRAMSLEEAVAYALEERA
ncbi:MAG: tetratricopeptide repeat protein, partial [Chloroflexi bacterium]|nr:tetratricopeptide repeat protein [Chloroflexota bacterium]